MQKEVFEKTKSINNLSYSGDITIKLADGDVIYSIKHYHNTGRNKLFAFFADCLAGNFNNAKSTRPCRVVLFELSDQESQADALIEGGLKQAIYDEEPYSFISTEAKAMNGWNDLTCVSTKVYYDNTPTILSDKDGSVVTYHFRIPYLCLVDGATVRKVGLYPNEISNYYQDLCAYYILPETDKIKIPTGGSNFTVIIDWQLKIKNKK